MHAVVIAHVVAAVLLLAASVVVGGWGLTRADRIARTGRSREGRAFGQLLQLSHTLVAATGLFGLMLLASGSRPHDPLHTRVYGPFMVVAVVAAYGYRTRDARANVRVFATAALVIAALGLRALATGG